LHSDFYPGVNSGVSYSRALSLAYEASQQTVSYGDDSLQFVEYWQPLNTERSELPAVILVHGGCWSNQFRVDQSYPAATAFSLNGFHIWSVEYRAVGDEGGGWPGTADDVQNAIVRILEEASTRYTPRKHIVIGHSAGGHLGLLALSNLQGSSEQPLRALGIAAITDIVSYANPLSSCGSFGQSFMGGAPEDIPDEYDAATPNFEALMELAFLYASSADNIAPLAQATSSGLPFINIEDAGHFDWIHPGTPAFDGLMEDLLNP
jgi:acetyl esterase/lipase